MTLFDILNSPWAIEPFKLREICEAYDARMRGEVADLAAIEARIGRPLDNPPQDYDVINGVAVVPLVGAIGKRANLFSQISGGASAELVARDLRAAASDPDVDAIILQIDSPGGTVDGTQQLAAVVREVGQTKPVIAFADGAMASAAYWVGSAASSVYVADGTTSVGSIGVVVEHADKSGADAQKGIKRTEVVAGKYKRIASSNAPLTESGQQSLQDAVDYIYSLFVQDVAANRGVSVDEVLESMAEGQVFIGQQAIDVGLADGMCSLDDLIANLSEQAAAQRAAGVTQQPSTSRASMDITQLKADHPQLAAGLREEGFQAGLEQGIAQGAKAELERVTAIDALAMPGHEKLIAELKADGKTTAGEVAVKILAADKAKLASMAAAQHSDAPAAVVPAAEPAVAAGKDADATLAKARVLARERGISLVAALKECGVR